MGDLLLSRAAVISDCGLYRYRLERDVGPSRIVASVIMVNPSTADGEVDDATIRKLMGFARRHDIGRVIVGNLFAWRATDINALRTASDPIGPDNDSHLLQIMREASLHIVAWGPLAKLPRQLRTRWREIDAIADRVGASLKCLGIAQDGHPRHPLMLAYDTPLVGWQPPGETR